jgi:hypothetical protein
VARQPKKDQYRYFSAGLALGLCKYDRYEFDQGKLLVEFALAQAIRKWEPIREFPAVLAAANCEGPNLDLYWIMQERDQDKRTPSVPFYWDRYSGVPRIYAFEHVSFNPDKEDDVNFVASMITSEQGISYHAWTDLAGSFLQKLDDS